MAGALLALIGTVIWQLLAFGIRAHTQGEAKRQSQATARRVLELITSEVRSAVTLPVSTPVMLSAVVWPDPWGAQSTATFADQFYLREELDIGEVGQQIRYDAVSNRVIFTRAGRRSDDSAFTSVDLNDYVYVEYLVPIERRHVLVRNVYRTQLLAGLTLETITDARSQAGPQWIINPDFFAGGLNLESSEVVVELDQPSDRINFRVLHPENINPADPGSAFDRQLFDTRVFRVEVQVGIGLTEGGQDPEDFGPEDRFQGREDQVAEVRVQSAETVR